MKFGKSFLKARTKQGMSQAEAAAALGVTPGFLSGIENDNKKPSVDLIIKAAELYHVQEGYFFMDHPDINIDELATEKNQNFIRDLDLAEGDITSLTDKYTIKFNGKELTENELKGIKAYLNSLRSMDT
ncbi:helix-turn-helix domain-containing protein [Bacillus testis]|uniref:helix-turn-helix domain-containing protein n=1 Tax=Bacillus testis TaxID=1622072 RepID=UPI00067E80AA|nr:helix-turn-helix transcriptional regulator [Bacillus testis]